MQIQPHLFIRDTCQLGEGPFWLADRLWWVDINAGRLLTVDAQGSDRLTYEMGRCVGAAAPAGNDKFIVALEDGIGLFDARSGKVEIMADSGEDIPGNRFNDGKCDPAGRFVVGTLNREGKRKAAALYSFEKERGLTKILDQVSLSNGMAWSRDGATFYYVDTHTSEIASFAYESESGLLGNREIVASIPREMGLPDGMEIDRAGNLWVAHWGGSAVRCWSPSSGQCVAEVRLPCPCPTSCCFGGPNLESLFITTAGSEIPDGEDPAASLAGSIFVCEPGVAGFPVRPFRL